ncbi:hypothetical protein ElyMa_004092400 [Elysia marginata]|uniref:Uncharacterized protein n=1 Tax=Elysia marginata TaxID=1093978 RepID=A0AAV4G9I4_9GAST|nr:hypothetical protein ElyMa_004092400 [Elysia marginata]
MRRKGTASAQRVARSTIVNKCSNLSSDTGVRSGADIDDQGFPSLSVLSLSEYVKVRQALARCIDEARQTVRESLSLSSASASSLHLPVQH